MRPGRFSSRPSERGQSLVEFALVLPLLLAVVLGVVDFGRAILYSNMLVNISREGANLAARTTESPQFIIDALNHTAAPLEMAAHGMIYVTRVVGVDDGAGGSQAQVTQQFRAIQGDWTLASRLWGCASWSPAGSCNLPGGETGRLVALALPLAIGEEINIVEAIYDYTSIQRYVMPVAPDLYSQTIL